MLVLWSREKAVRFFVFQSNERTASLCSSTHLTRLRSAEEYGTLPARVPGQASGCDNGCTRRLLLRADDEPHGHVFLFHGSHWGHTVSLPGEPI